jgi:hypothetical protein
VIIGPVVVISLAVGLVLAACGATADTSRSPAAPIAATPALPTATAAAEPSSSASRPAPAESLATLLDELVVAPEHRVGYDRDLFPLWTDDDVDGCNTRYEVLLDEAVVAPDITGSCDLAGGVWLSPYDGVTLRDASQVQIDHLVALAEAWYSGAHLWTTERRERFANDLAVPWALNAVSPDVNQAKSADDPAHWLPPRPAALCPYLESWIGTKVRWALTIDPAEKQALAELIRRCPGSELTVPLAP